MSKDVANRTVFCNANETIVDSYLLSYSYKRVQLHINCSARFSVQYVHRVTTKILLIHLLCIVHVHVQVHVHVFSYVNAHIVSASDKNKNRRYKKKSNRHKWNRWIFFLIGANVIHHYPAREKPGFTRQGNTLPTLFFIDAVCFLLWNHILLFQIFYVLVIL